MKTKTISLIASFIFILFSCTNDEDEIMYPEMGLYGDNLLSFDSTEIFSNTPVNKNDWVYYSLRAELPEGTSLKVIMKSTYETGNGTWSYNLGSKTGWSIDAIKNDEMLLNTCYAYGPSVCDVKMSFYEHGSGSILIYENDDSTPTRVKNISWK
ncbi:MAG: hypothetical protein K9H26_17810 [Prolixibacteraceae bacterium]|nr:hypothetical protein [Prolixibacteraceae bacterium]